MHLQVGTTCEAEVDDRVYPILDCEDPSLLAKVSGTVPCNVL